MDQPTPTTTGTDQSLQPQGKPNNPHHIKGRKGIMLIGVGVVLCVTGFVLVITQETGTVFNFALYGMTGAGGSCIMGGLALIMG